MKRKIDNRGRKILLLDEDGSIHEIHERKKYVIKRSSLWLKDSDVVFESNDIDEILKEYEVLHLSGVDDINFNIEICGLDGEYRGGASGNVDFMRKYLTEYK